MALTLSLPTAAGTLAAYELRGTAPLKPTKGATFNRIAYSAAHVVSNPLAAVDPWLTAAIDWDATIAYRRHLWSLGLGVAEAMDTAQRGMGLDWPTSLELIRRSIAASKDVPGAFLHAVVDGDAALRVQLVHQLADGGFRHQLVLGPVQDQPGTGAWRKEAEIVVAGRGGDGDEAAHLRPPHQQLHADIGAEGIAGHPQHGGVRVHRLQEVERRGGV